MWRSRCGPRAGGPGRHLHGGRVPGRVFHGKVTRSGKAPINVQNVVTYDVVIGVANPDLKLFPGMTANVKILIDRRQGRAEGSQRGAAFPSGDATPPPDASAGSGNGRARGQAQPAADGVGSWTARASKPQPVQVTARHHATARYTEITGGDLQEATR